jgi:SsrA-binding protein
MEKDKIIIFNKKILRDFEIIDKIEAGIMLNGHEAKSLREGKASIDGSFIKEYNGEFFINNMFIARNPSIHTSDPEKRRRKLLMHKNEIIHFSTKVKEKGLTLLPLDVHTLNNKIKITIVLAKHKNIYGDKRKAEEKRLKEETRNIRRKR